MFLFWSYFSFSSYFAAIKSSSSSTETALWVNIKRGLGNVENELGVYNMDKAAALVGIDAEQSLQEKNLLQRSSSNFESGISTFDLINDRLVKSVLDFLIGTLSIDDETDDDASQPRQTGPPCFRRGTRSLSSAASQADDDFFFAKNFVLLQNCYGILTGCPVPIFSCFLSIFLFSPIFKQKPPIFLLFSW